MTQRNEARRTHCVAWQIVQTWQAAEWCRLDESPTGNALAGGGVGGGEAPPGRSG